MKKLMHKIMLDCDKATLLISLKKYKKLTFIERVQLVLHLMACKYCKRFSNFNDFIDDNIVTTCDFSLSPDDILSEDKKLHLKEIIEDTNH